VFANLPDCIRTFSTLAKVKKIDVSNFMVVGYSLHKFSETIMCYQYSWVLKFFEPKKLANKYK